MIDDLLRVRIDVAPVVVVAALVTLALGLLVVLRPLETTELRGRWLRRALVVLLAVAAVAAVTVFVLTDVVDVLGIPIGPESRAGIVVGAGLAGLGVAVAAAGRRWRIRPARRALGGLLVVLAVLTAALAVNAETGMVRTAEALFPPPVVDVTGGGGGAFPPRIETGAAPVSAGSWTPPADLPSTGSVVSVDIPGTVSGFTARPAVVYLPPAALVANPPALPVMVLLSGQPGVPADILQAGRFQETLGAFAASHGGLAPIVVSPDQLGTIDANPMCVDGPLGASATYLATDVHDWILRNLNVATGRLAWSFGGFSQGGTCTYQIGLAAPDVYGTDIAISGELEPSLAGDAASTLANGFGGDQRAYDAAKPLQVMAAGAPFRDTLLIQGVGQNDAVFTMWSDQLQQGAEQAGIQVSRITSSGTSHDFNTVADVLQQALPTFAARSGLVAA